MHCWDVVASTHAQTWAATPHAPSAQMLELVGCDVNRLGSGCVALRLTWHGVLSRLVCCIHRSGYPVASHLHHGLVHAAHSAREHLLLGAHGAHHTAGLRQTLKQ